MACSKVRFSSRIEAKKAARLTRGGGGKSRRAYFCPECQFWHTTSQTATAFQRAVEEDAAYNEWERRNAS